MDQQVGTLGELTSAVAHRERTVVGLLMIAEAGATLRPFHSMIPQRGADVGHQPGDHPDATDVELAIGGVVKAHHAGQLVDGDGEER